MTVPAVARTLPRDAGASLFAGAYSVSRGPQKKTGIRKRMAFHYRIVRSSLRRGRAGSKDRGEAQKNTGSMLEETS